MDIIIFGTGSISEKLKKMFRKHINVVAYVDNNQSILGLQRDSIPIINPKKISSIEYDYIVIASQFSNEINNQLLQLSIAKEKIIDFYFIINKEFNWVKHDINVLTSDEFGFECLVTGLSYAKSGIKQELLKYKTYNLAHASQDLNEDYNIMKIMLKSDRNYMRKIKFVMITLSYYSFQYDLSLSKMKNISQLYKDAFNRIEENEEHKVKLKILKKIVEFKLYEKVFFNNIDCVYDQYKWKEEGEKVAKIDCNKNYPKTVEKNKEILKKYLNLLKENNIIPIVIVLPGSYYYTKYFSSDLEEEFKGIIREFKNKYDFQYLDYFKSEFFEYEDFKDVSHLNEKGAIKFTKILNKDIEWSEID